jgi:geranylgeranyl reductase
MVETFDCVVVGGGPSGATAAADLAKQGRSVLMLDKAGRIKPCGGAIPPRVLREFDIPASLLCAKVNGARMISPKAKQVHMPINGWVGMVDRDKFDEFLRARAVEQGAERQTGKFDRVERDDDGTAIVVYGAGGTEKRVRARTVIGADGALSKVGRQCVKGAEKTKFVFAYHEIVRAPQGGFADYDQASCDVVYDAKYSPDFYSWIFPHGDTASIGTGSAQKGFSLKGSVGALRQSMGLDGVETLRREGAPLPLKPLRKWDNGNDVVLAGDAAGCVAPASGEGIYYAMLGGRLAADAVATRLQTGDGRALAQARRRFMKAHGQTFMVLGFMQWFWYSSDWRRERFVAICRDKDVQQLTWDAYMNKELVYAKPAAHAKIFFKNMGYLTGLVAA